MGDERPTESGTGEEEYKVGRGRPPKHSQFKKGQSGNPGGQPKGRLHLATRLKGLLLKSAEELQKIESNPKTPMGVVLLCRQIQRAEGLEGIANVAMASIYDRNDGLAGKEQEELIESVVARAIQVKVVARDPRKDDDDDGESPDEPEAEDDQTERG